jgi:uncharacterized membrane protein YobD (UPF0266 family)
MCVCVYVSRLSELQFRNFCAQGARTSYLKDFVCLFFVLFLYFDCPYIILKTSPLFKIHHLERTDLGVNNQKQQTLINTGNSEFGRELWTAVVHVIKR